ncbi:hypothetical protein MC885_013424, partial [Smutsia gigantea]
ECAARGEDYERVKLLESEEKMQRWKRKTLIWDFSDHAAGQLSQYHWLTKQIKPDMETYERLRKINMENSTSNSLLHGTHVASTEETDGMVVDLEKQPPYSLQTTSSDEVKNKRYTWRHPYNDDADVNINERNAKFNKKAERFCGKYTAEMKTWKGEQL